MKIIKLSALTIWWFVLAVICAASATASIGAGKVYLTRLLLFSTVVFTIATVCAGIMAIWKTQEYFWDKIAYESGI